MKKLIYWKGIRAYFGLMFQLPKKDTIYVLDIGEEKDIGAHTFFCLKSLDMIFLDKNLNVVERYYKVKPFRVLNLRKKFRYLVEGLEISEKDLEFVREYLSSRNFVK